MVVAISGSRSRGVIIEQKNIYIDCQAKYSEGLLPFGFDEKFQGRFKRYGFVDLDGKIAIDPKYEYVHGFSEGLAAVLSNGLWGFIDRSGKIVIEPQFKHVDNFSEGLCSVLIPSGFLSKRFLWGFINTKGNVVIGGKYGSSGSFKDGYAWVQEPLPPIDNRDYEGPVGGDVCVIDTHGNMVVENLYCPRGRPSDGVSACFDRGSKKYSFYDSRGRKIIKAKYNSANDFHDGLALVKLNGKYGYINISGDVVINPIFTYDGKESDFKDGLAVQSLDNHTFGVIDKTGRWVISPRYCEHYPEVKEGGVAFANHVPYGYNECYGCKYTLRKGEVFTGFTHEGLIMISRREKKNVLEGLVDKNGKVIVPPKFNRIGTFHEGLAQVEVGGNYPGGEECNAGRYGYIDKNGKLIIPPIYNSGTTVSNGCIAVKINGKWGILYNPLK